MPDILSPAQNYEEASRLMCEGRKVVERIGKLADERKIVLDTTTNLAPDYRAEAAARITQQMDELGKKAHGTWLQAQVHATLATVPAEVAERARATVKRRG